MALIRPDLESYIGSDEATRTVHEQAARVVMAEAVALRMAIFTNTAPEGEAILDSHKVFAHQYGAHVELYGEPRGFVHDASGRAIAPLSAAHNLEDALNWKAVMDGHRVLLPRVIELVAEKSQKALKNTTGVMLSNAPYRLSERDFIAFSNLGINEAGVEVPGGIQGVLMDAHRDVPVLALSETSKIHRYVLFTSKQREVEKLFEAGADGTLTTTKSFVRAMEVTERCRRDGVTLAGYPAK